VLSDLVMPEMGGQALFHALRKRGLILPEVMLSGHPMETELEHLRAQGLAGWLRKPPDVVRLSRMLPRALAAHRRVP
jgi:CheY-like chemotaxis protein